MDVPFLHAARALMEQTGGDPSDPVSAAELVADLHADGAPFTLAQAAVAALAAEVDDAPPPATAPPATAPPVDGRRFLTDLEDVTLALVHAQQGDPTAPPIDSSIDRLNEMLGALDVAQPPGDGTRAVLVRVPRAWHVAPDAQGHDRVWVDLTTGPAPVFPQPDQFAFPGRSDRMGSLLNTAFAAALPRKQWAVHDVSEDVIVPTASEAQARVLAWSLTREWLTEHVVVHRIDDDADWEAAGLTYRDPAPQPVTDLLADRDAVAQWIGEATRWTATGEPGAVEVLAALRREATAAGHDIDETEG